MRLGLAVGFRNHPNLGVSWRAHPRFSLLRPDLGSDCLAEPHTVTMHVRSLSLYPRNLNRYNDLTLVRSLCPPPHTVHLFCSHVRESPNNPFMSDIEPLLDVTRLG